MSFPAERVSNVEFMARETNPRQDGTPMRVVVYKVTHPSQDRLGTTSFAQAINDTNLRSFAAKPVAQVLAAMVGHF